MGAIVLNGAKIGSDCIVGAGPGHRKNGRPGRVHDQGSPAKVVRPLKPEEIRRQPGSHGGEYLEAAAQYREGAGSPLRQALSGPRKEFTVHGMKQSRRSKDFCWWSGGGVAFYCALQRLDAVPSGAGLAAWDFGAVSAGRRPGLYPECAHAGIERHLFPRSRKGIGSIAPGQVL